MSPTAIPFAGRLTEPDFLRVQRSLMPGWTRWPVMLLLMLNLFILIGVGWSAVLASPWAALPDLIEAGVVVGLAALLQRWMHRRNFRTYSRLHGAVSGRQDDAGIEWRTEATTTVLPWAKLCGHRIDDTLALIFYAPRCAFFVPRSFVASDADWQALRELLAQYGQPRR